MDFHKKAFVFSELYASAPAGRKSGQSVEAEHRTDAQWLRAAVVGSPQVAAKHHGPPWDGAERRSKAKKLCVVELFSK